MNEAEPQPVCPLSEEFKQRCAADLAAGRTVSLESSEMLRPELREHLPQLLEELERSRSRGPQPALRVPGYTVLGEIGRGGMSTVYLARHDTLGRHVAIKIVPNWFGGQQRARERLLREAQAMAKVSHPNIVTIHDIVEDGDTIAIAMEWIDGLSLAGILQALPETPGDDDMVIVRHSLGTPADGADRLGPDVVRTFARIVRDVARAVQAVHDRGLLHLDIKPSNVLVRRDGTPLLADFGVVREIDLVLTHTRSFAGTPVYAAPEQLHRDDKAFGPPTDVYGLGITLYELLARAQPLHGSSLTKLVADVVAGRIPELGSLTSVPPDLANVVHRAIAPEPARRYPTAAAFAEDLTAFLEGRPVAARPITRMERAGRWIRAEPWQALFAAVLLVMVPVVLVLGGKLLAELPRIDASRQRELRADVYAWEQRGIQSLLVQDQENAEVVAKLRQIHADDPEDVRALACLLTLLGQSRVDEARAELVRDQALLKRHRGLQLFEQRLRDRRPYFADAEVAELLASKDRLDLLLAILSRILEVKDTQVVDPLEEIQSALALTLATGPDPDPLLHGLQAWSAAQLRDDEQLDISCRALATHWPGDPVACWWRMLATDLVDPAAARKIGADFEAAHPGTFASAVMISRSFAIEGKFAEALATLDASPPPKDDEAELRHWKLLRARHLGSLHRPEEARRELPERRAGDDAARWLLVEEKIDAAAAKRLYLEGVQAEAPSLLMLLQAKDFAAERAYLDLLEVACERGIALHPHRAAFLWPAAKLAHQRKDFVKGAELSAGLKVPRHLVDDFGSWRAQCLASVKDWRGMLAHCERWKEFSRTDSYRWNYYLGVALSRCGDYERADACFDRHLQEGAAPSVPGARAKYYIEAFFERMWIRVSGPPSLRDPKQALAMCGKRELVYMDRSQGRAWMLAVLAEVHFANGDKQTAIDKAEAALEVIAKADVLAPADLGTMLTEALARYRN